MATRTRFLFLMHPKEYKEEKAGTGRLTRLCLTNSELHMGKGFDEDAVVQAVLDDPKNFPVLLYPGATAVNLSAPTPEAAERVAEFAREIGDRQLVVVLLDATWALARKMLRLSPSLQRLPRVMFTPSAPSRYVIKQQPQEGCLSTLEAVHELLLVLEQRGLDRYERPEQLLTIFARMQDFQLKCAADPARDGYRRRPYSKPEERPSFQGTSRRSRFLRAPTE